jgi:hypothetical protein
MLRSMMCIHVLGCTRNAWRCEILWTSSIWTSNWQIQKCRVHELSVSW